MKSLRGQKESWESCREVMFTEQPGFSERERMKGTFRAELEHIRALLLTEGALQRAHMKGLGVKRLEEINGHTACYGNASSLDDGWQRCLGSLQMTRENQKVRNDRINPASFLREGG